MYLGITPSLIFSTEDGCEFTLHLDDNPLAVFVELPKNLIRTLWYSNILCGVIRGALEMINIKVETFFISDTLNGDAATEIKVKVISTGGEYTIQDD